MAPPSIVTAMTTPFTHNGEIDLGAFRALIVHVALHVDAVMTPGTNGEFPALTSRERADLIETAIGLLGSDRVIAHVGAPSTHQALVELRGASAAGATRYTAITPYFLPASPDQLLAYYGALREQCDGELLAYVYPEVTGTTVTPEQMAQLAAIGVDGAKLSGSAAGDVEKHIAAVPTGWPIWSGSDGEYPRVMRAGGAGVVSGVSGVAPQVWGRLRDTWLARDDAGFEATQDLASRLVACAGRSIACLKYALDVLQLPGGPTRMAIDPPTATEQAAIRQVLAEVAANVDPVPA